MLGTVRATLVLFSLPFFLSQELEDESRVISVALVDDKFEVLSGGKYVEFRSYSSVPLHLGASLHICTKN